MSILSRAPTWVALCGSGGTLPFKQQPPVTPAIHKATSCLEDAERDGLVNGHGGADAHPDGVEGAEEEHGGGDGAAEGVLELVDGLNEGHGDEADGHRRHGEDAQQLVGDHAQGVEGGEEVPLGEDLQGGGEGVGGLAQRSGLHHGQAHGERDRAEDDDGEDVQQVVGPGGLAVVVVAHALGELGAQHGVRQVGLLGHGGHHLEGAAGLGGGHAEGSEGLGDGAELGAGGGGAHGGAAHGHLGGGGGADDEGGGDGSHC
mmetsp:Transcript_36286/g.89390  ORF Transcript_36286/g.89390 Transcript_36286/m.89390 type:complete len:259 (+) Transcript_36286:138-914(+)